MLSPWAFIALIADAGLPPKTLDAYPGSIAIDLTMSGKSEL
ncbi:hypothetical protein UMNF18_2376 [Escherichia coli UMNF18]|nr:hypothetical protein UMNF18_2376 [Escherichia coli UMNF18]ASO94000.1 hypothetical protein AKO64_2862 [Escherichia coli]EII45650.1 hypothetical protein EC23916_2019 [Escherichia coli 2.3916]VEW01704.1 conserved hypothetical protein [Escherichia coli]